MKYLLMHKRTAVLELDIDKLGMIAKIGAVSAPEHLPVGVRIAEFIDETRRNAIVNAVVKRMAMLKEIADCIQIPMT